MSSPEPLNADLKESATDELVAALSVWTVGLGVVFVGAFPLAIPIVVLTAIALIPLALPLLAVLALAAAVSHFDRSPELG